MGGYFFVLSIYAIRIITIIDIIIKTIYSISKSLISLPSSLQISLFRDFYAESAPLAPFLAYSGMQKARQWRPSLHTQVCNQRVTVPLLYRNFRNFRTNRLPFFK